MASTTTSPSSNVRRDEDSRAPKSTIDAMSSRYNVLAQVQVELICGSMLNAEYSTLETTSQAEEEVLPLDILGTGRNNNRSAGSGWTHAQYAFNRNI